MTTRAERRATQERQRLVRAAEKVGLEVKWCQEADVTDEEVFTEVVLVRHGETHWNVQHRLQGQQDCALNELGVKQAYAVAEYLRASCENVHATYSSDLSRAYNTAEIIANALGQSQVQATRLAVTPGGHPFCSTREKPRGFRGTYYRRGTRKVPKLCFRLIERRALVSNPGRREHT